MMIVTKIPPATLRAHMTELLEQQRLQLDVCSHQALIGADQVRARVTLYQQRIATLEQFLEELNTSARSYK